MMSRLFERAQALASSAQRRRLKEIAAAVQARGLLAEMGSDTVVVRGRALARRWLSDPLVRFAGRIAS